MKQKLKLPEVKGKYRENFLLSKSNWFQVGGEAEILFKPADINDLVFFLKNKPENMPVTILGVGSNVIIRDGGIEGVVIKLGRNFTDVHFDDENHIVEVGAACLDVNLANLAAFKGYANLEFLSGIPGAIGGAIAMNAGCYGSEIKDILIEVEAIDYNGNIVLLKNDDFKFSYRHNNLKNKYIFTKAKFKLKKDSPDQVIERISEIKNKRENTQPIRSKTSGSSFKNPQGLKAWELIDKAGLRGFQINDAKISDLHCNFMINLNNANAKDLEDLGEYVRKKIYDEQNIMLEWEIERIGKY